MAKNSKDIMYVKERLNRFNELSLILHCSGKDPLTRKNKVYVKTYQVPSELKGKKEIELYRSKVQHEWKSEVEKISLGTIIKQEKILFRDFALEWVETILDRKKQGYNYYRKCKDNLPILLNKFQSYYLHEISQSTISNFLQWLNKRTYEKHIIAVKGNLMPIIESKGLSLKATARNAGVSHTTLFEALKIGSRISKDSMLKICNYLAIDTNKYFECKKEKIQYSLSSNQDVRGMLHNIFARAVKQGLMEKNFISSDYSDPVTGRDKDKKEILDNKGDIQSFMRHIEQEIDIRKKVAFSIYINLGLRNAEVVGLEWSAINFENSTISITQNTIYVSGFGTVTKDPKTKRSYRVLSVPSSLMELLKEYKK